MYIRDARTPDEEAAYTAANDEFDAACAERDAFPRGSDEAKHAQELVNTAYSRLHKANSLHFQLNNGGMGRTCKIMARYGMLKPAIDGDVPWPEAPEDYWEWADLDDDARPANPAYEAIRAAYEHKLTVHSGDTPGVAENKFSSNDGWIVTPGEAKSVQGLWNKMDPAERAAVIDEAYWFGDWVLFNARAATRNGYTVY